MSTSALSGRQQAWRVAAARGASKRRALALSTSFVLPIVIFVLLGITGITCATSTNSLLQLNTPEQLRGRVMSINVLLARGNTPIGGLFLGSVGQAIGVGYAIFACAGLCLAGIAVAVWYRWRMARR